MLISKKAISLPSKKLITDLATRTGYATANSLSPYKGRSKEVQERFSRLGYDGSLAEMINNLKDYNADKQKPMSGLYQKPEERDEIYTTHDPNYTNATMYLRRLEDIEDDWVYNYLDQAIENQLKRSNKNGIKSYKYENQTQFAISYEDDDGEESSHTLGELETLRTNSSDERSLNERIPYLLKKLHERSKEIGVHLISLLIAYDKASRLVDIENETKTYQSDVQKSKIASFKVYEMYESGAIGGVLTESSLANGNKRRGNMIKWVKGEEPDTYSNYAFELLSACAQIGYPLRGEDPLQYTESFIAKLACSYIASNNEYLANTKKKYSDIILNILENVDLVMYPKTKFTEQEEENDIIAKMCNHTCDCFLAQYETLADSDADYCDLQKGITLLFDSRLPERHWSISEEGFVVFTRRDWANMPIIFNVEGYCNLPMLAGHKRAILHKSGYLIILTQTNIIKRVHINHALSWVFDKDYKVEWL